MADRRSPDHPESTHTAQTPEDTEPLLTSPADVASAGRSCMAIVVLVSIIILVLVVWVAYRAVGGP